MITDILANPASFSLPALLTVVGTFGFAPGFCMRLIALMYPRSDPRRKELYAEMKAVPRIERPLWVAEQLETVLFEAPASRRRATRERKRKRSQDNDPPQVGRAAVNAMEIRTVSIVQYDEKGNVISRIEPKDAVWRYDKHLNQER